MRYGDGVVADEDGGGARGDGRMRGRNEENEVSRLCTYLNTWVLGRRSDHGNVEYAGARITKF